MKAALWLWVGLWIGGAPAYAAGVVEAGGFAIEESPSEAVTAAQEALRAGRWEEAARAFRALAEAGGGAPARLTEAVAWYEAGEMGPARGAVEAALVLEPGNLEAQNLRGLVLVDTGRVEEGRQALLAALAAAQQAKQPSVEARISINLGLAALDRGEEKEAIERFRAGAELAKQAGEANLQAIAERGLNASDGLAGREKSVGNQLGKGQVAGARAAATAQLKAAQTRREKVNAAIELAAVERSEGALGSSVARLNEALTQAREAGMVREQALALTNIGLAQSLAGRLPVAADNLNAAVRLAKDGGYKVVEVDARIELGRVYVLMERLVDAEAQQRQAGSLLATMNYPQGVALQAELGGQIAGAKGDLATATAALSKAASYQASIGRSLDAARAATTLAAALERGGDTAGADLWAKKAAGYFAQAKDPMGPAHISMARGLAAAKAKNLDAALAHFTAAASAAAAVGGESGAAMEQIARENAAAALLALGSGEDLATKAKEGGLEELVKQQAQFRLGMVSYEDGLAAYNKGQFAEANKKFVAAAAAFDALGEADYALRCRRASGWARYNLTIAMPAATAWPVWAKLVQEVVSLGDGELYTRTYGAEAVAAQSLQKPDVTPRLNECIRLARAQALPDVEARCHGALAEQPGDLDLRATHARAAWGLKPGEAYAVYAAYTVAVDAYNADRMPLALEMAQLARPAAGQLAGQLDQIIAAARP